MLRKPGLVSFRFFRRVRVSSYVLRALGGVLGAASVLGAITSATGCDDKKTPTVATSAATPLTSSAVDAAPTAASSPTLAASGAVSALGSADASAAAAPDAIAAQHILIAYKGAAKAPRGVTRSKAEAKSRAEDVAGKAKAGADFSALVAEYSDDPAAKERQGSLGKFTRDKMAKAFSDAAFALRVDEISAPVETPFGFHVIKRNQ